MVRMDFISVLAWKRAEKEEGREGGKKEEEPSRSSTFSLRGTPNIYVESLFVCLTTYMLSPGLGFSGFLSMGEGF